MRAIAIDDFLEALDDAPDRVSGAVWHWGRLIAEGRAARTAADGGRWKIGRLALLAERKYRSGALQRFAREIGEAYATVRRYRWVAGRYEADAPLSFPSLSFSHFQAVASLPDRTAWLRRAEKGLWSVERLVREARTGVVADGRAQSVERLRSQVDSLMRSLSRLRELDEEVASAARDWLLDALEEISAEAAEITKRLRKAPRVRAVAARR